MKKRNLIVLILLALTFSISISISSASPRVIYQGVFQNGGSCPKQNQVVNQGDYRFTCLKRLNINVWVAVALKTPPLFIKQNVLQFTSPFAPLTKIEYIVLWNGEDIQGVTYPVGTKTTVKVDGINSNYIAYPGQPITLFLTNVVHKFALVVLVPKLASQTSNTLSIPPLDLTLLSNASIKDSKLVPPVLTCTGSGELSGAHPGWSSVSSVKLTEIDFGSGSHALFWCPSAAPNGSGKISYTVTASPGGYTCETRLLTCIIVGIPGKYSYQISSTDETGTYYSGLATVASSGLIPACIPGPLTCNIANALMVLHTYGNVPPTSLGDCTFAAIANWEHIAFGIVPDATELGIQFSEAGGAIKTGLSDAQTFDYWGKTPISGVSLISATTYPPDPEDIRSAIDSTPSHALIASLHAQAGQFLGNIMFTSQSFHWIVVDGYTQRGPLVVTWGQTVQMTWQQWNREVGTVWQIAANFSPPGT